jgi:hypothetical protein
VADEEGRGVGVPLAGAFVVVFVAVVAGLDFSVRVGAAFGVAVVGVLVGVALGVVGVAVGVVGVALGVVGVALGVVGVAVGVLAVAVGVVGAEVGVCEVGVGEGDGLGGVVGSCSGSHDSPLDVAAVLAAAVLAATVRLAPEAASRTLPAISVTVAGRACPKRMKRPISAARRVMSSIGYQAPREALPALLPRSPQASRRRRQSGPGSG